MGENCNKIHTLFNTQQNILLNVTRLNMIPVIKNDSVSNLNPLGQMKCLSFPVQTSSIPTSKFSLLDYIKNNLITQSHQKNRYRFHNHCNDIIHYQLYIPEWWKRSIKNCF